MNDFQITDISTILCCLEVELINISSFIRPRVGSNKYIL